MRKPYSLSTVIRDLREEKFNGWTGYTEPNFIKQWYFIEGVPLGYVLCYFDNAPSPDSFNYGFGMEFHGGFASVDEAKEAMIKALQKWCVFLLPMLGGTD